MQYIADTAAGSEVPWVLSTEHWVLNIMQTQIDNIIYNIAIRTQTQRNKPILVLRLQLNFNRPVYYTEYSEYTQHTIYPNVT